MDAWTKAHGPVMRTELRWQVLGVSEPARDVDWTYRPQRTASRGDSKRAGDRLAELPWVAPHRWRVTIVAMKPGTHYPDPRSPLLS